MAMSMHKYMFCLKSTSTKSIFEQEEDHEHGEIVYVGSAKRRYVINSKYLIHPAVSALIERSKQNPGKDICIRCEVVMFEHLLWMVDNAADHLISGASFEELADLYLF
ncbi:hypothetical protein QQ045_015977 [Rhodiola kirilowii]